MSYFSGRIGSSLPTTLHVCIDHLRDGRLIQTLHTGAALVQPILRARLCVRHELMLHGEPCTPVDYIAAWRTVQARTPQATLQAWLAEFQTTITMDLPQPGAKHAYWLSPVYHQAVRRLFAAEPHGHCTAEIRRPDDILDAVAVQHGLAAFDFPLRDLNAVIQTRTRGAHAFALTREAA